MLVITRGYLGVPSGGVCQAQLSLHPQRADNGPQCWQENGREAMGNTREIVENHGQARFHGNLWLAGWFPDSFLVDNHLDECPK